MYVKNGFKGTVFTFLLGSNNANLGFGNVCGDVATEHVNGNIQIS